MPITDYYLSEAIASEQACLGQTAVSKTVPALTCLTNNARKYHSLPTLADCQALLAAGGRWFDYWIKAKGYAGNCYGENIAMGQKTPHDVFVAWMNSPGHGAKVLNSQYRDFGVAETAGSQGPMWVMELGGC